MASQGYDVVSPSQHHALTVEPDDGPEDDLVAYTQDSINLNSPALDTKKGKSKAPTAAHSSGGGSGGVSGSIGGAASGRGGAGGSRGMRQQIGGIITETRFSSGINTLDEPVFETIMRDLTAIGQKMVLILYPAGSASSKALLREWDLWGPLVACLGLAVILSFNAPPKQSLAVFTGVFVIVWVGSLVVTLNSRLLGGKVSLFQSICVLGYCLFPIMVAALVALFVHFLVVRIIVGVGGWLWSVWAAMNFFGGTRLEDGRTFLAVYPILLLYMVLSFLVIVG